MKYSFPRNKESVNQSLVSTKGEQFSSLHLSPEQTTRLRARSSPSHQLLQLFSSACFMEFLLSFFQNLCGFHLSAVQGCLVLFRLRLCPDHFDSLLFVFIRWRLSIFSSIQSMPGFHPVNFEDLVETSSFKPSQYAVYPFIFYI